MMNLMMNLMLYHEKIKRRKIINKFNFDIIDDDFNKTDSSNNESRYKIFNNEQKVKLYIEKWYRCHEDL